MSYHPNDLLRRARVARLLLVAAFVALGSAFFRAQVLQSAEYVLQSESNRLREVPLPGARGIIYDRTGKEIIAENLPGYSVSILVPNEDSLKIALTALNNVVPIDTTMQKKAIRSFRLAPTRPAVIFNDASFEVIAVLEERRVEFPGLIIQSIPKRFYPDGEATAALVGYTGLISEEELGKDRFKDYEPGQQVGKGGLELQYEERLRGLEGARYVEVDSRNRVVRNDVRPETPASSPEPLRTNIDLDLQRYAHEYFGDSLRGGMVALDPNTGGVLALYSAPTYDANRFIGGVSASYYKSLLDHPHRPLFNRALNGRYAPASTFKLATAIIGMERGLVDLDTRQPQGCTGGFYFGRYFRCWDKKGHGDVTLQQAIAKSCDVYFYQLALKIGMANLLAGGVKLGFDKKTKLDLPGEYKPNWPADTKYYDRRYGPRGWSRSIALSLAIGQAENQQTPLSMAKFYTALATDGSAATPQIVPRATEREKIIDLTPAQLSRIQLALADVVSRGTAAGAQIAGLTIAGKTGTAQNPPYPDNAWFVGYAPIDKPKIVVAILIEEGLHGSTAARVATKMMERYLKARLTLNIVTND